MTPASLLKRSTAILTLAGALSAAPLHLTLHPAEGFWPVAVPAALARGGDDDGGSDDSGGGSGSGSGGGSDDRSGSDDHGGSGNGSGGGSDDASDSDDHGGSGSGSGGGSDDRSGSNRGRDDSGSGRNDATARHHSGADSAHEATLADGSRIEIENGRVEIKDAAGRTIVERPATAEDRALLQKASTGTASAAGGGAALPPRNGTRGGGLVAGVEVYGENIEILYSDGWTEEIENGRYQLKDAANRTVVERPARPADRDRLFAAVR